MKANVLQFFDPVICLHVGNAITKSSSIRCFLFRRQKGNALPHSREIFEPSPRRCNDNSIPRKAPFLPNTPHYLSRLAARRVYSDSQRVKKLERKSEKKKTKLVARNIIRYIKTRSPVLIVEEIENSIVVSTASPLCVRPPGETCHAHFSVYDSDFSCKNK